MDNSLAAAGGHLKLFTAHTTPVTAPPEPSPTTPAATPDTSADLREQLVNAGEGGTISSVSIPESLVTSLRGILLDFDPHLYDPARLPTGATESPSALYEQFVEPMLGRHPVFAAAEVRDSGRGLHAIVRFEPPVPFATEGERQRWAAAVKVVQRVLPTDPDAPGITALTRPLGSINSKTGRPVASLRAGTPVDPAEVLDLVEAVRRAPFKTVAGLVAGPTLSPCPVCRLPGTRLGLLDRVGRCYGKCGKITLEKFLDAYYAPRPTAGEG